MTCTYTNTQRGSITIIKNTNARRGPGLRLHDRPAPALSSFTLDDDGVNDGLNGDILNTKVFNNLAPGAYSVTETLPVTGYDLTNLVCNSTGTGTSDRRTSAPASSTITSGPAAR